VTAVTLIAPHGGHLVDRQLAGLEREAALERARGLPRVRLSSRSASDLELIGVGGFSPLTGFMGERDYRSVIDQMRLASGCVWPLPVVLPVGREVASAVREGQEVALEGPDGQLLGLMRVSEWFARDREAEAVGCYGTADLEHPGVRQLSAEGEFCLGGEIWLLNRTATPFLDERLDPAEVRRAIAELGWRRVVGFQTRNPIHRAHEYLIKCALEICDGALIHPLVGETKADDIPAGVRMRAYQALVRSYFPPGRALLAVFPAAMRYAGPREALFHALCRKNYGCTHFIVGRDHAGVGGYYGPYDAQRIFDRFIPSEIGITPLCFEDAFYCRHCAGMASRKSCPHGDEVHIRLSGTQVRAMLRAGEVPPPEFSRPEVAAVLVEGLRGERE
jgi:sulfate adenylyltransferase